MCDLGGSISICDLPLIAHITLAMGALIVISSISFAAIHLNALRS